MRPVQTLAALRSGSPTVVASIAAALVLVTCKPTPTQQAESQ